MKKITKILSLAALSCTLVLADDSAIELIEKSVTKHPSILAKNAAQFATEYEKDSAFYQFFATPSVNYERN